MANRKSPQPGMTRGPRQIPRLSTHLNHEKPFTGLNRGSNSCLHLAVLRNLTGIANPNSLILWLLQENRDLVSRQFVRGDMVFQFRLVLAAKTRLLIAIGHFGLPLVFDWRFGDADVCVCAAVIEQVSITSLQHAFHENYVGDLTDFLPILLGPEYGLIASPQ